MAAKPRNSYARIAAVTALAVVGMALAACGAGRGMASGPEPTPDTSLRGILATTDLGVGESRVAFLLVDDDGLVTAPSAEVQAVYLPGEDAEPEPGPSATARFHLWPYATRGNYVAPMTFDRPGKWRLDVEITGEGGAVERARIPFTVMEEPLTPAVGSAAPPVDTKTARDVASPEELTTWSEPDLSLYVWNLRDALADDMPVVLVISSPAFCTTPTCGPQVETVSELAQAHRGQAHFIHVEVYDNPHEIQGVLDNGRYAPIIEAWRIVDAPDYLNESWVFIFDREGRVAAKYQAFASLSELEEGLAGVL